MPAAVARSRFGQMCQPSERRQRERSEKERKVEREQTRKISLVLKLEHLVFSLDFRAGAS